MRLCWLLPLCVFGCQLAGDRLYAEMLQKQVTPFLENHCIGCHSGEEAKGSLDFESSSFDLKSIDNRQRWVTVYDRVSLGEMPPNTEPRPDKESKAAFLKQLEEALTQADLDSRKPILRRLNRNEYQNTVSDLFSIFIDLGNVLPDDSPEQGFDTAASVLAISTEQMLGYLEAADLVLDEVFGPKVAPRRIDQTVNFKDLRSRTTADRITPDGAVLFSGAKSLPMYGVSVSGPAEYRLRIQAKAIQAERPIIMRVEGGVTGRIPGHIAGFFEVPPGKLTTIEMTDRAIESSDTFAFALEGGFPWWSVNDKDYSGVGLFLGDITIEGPLEEWPRPSRKKLLGDIDPATGGLEEIRSVLLQVLPRAFRRAEVEDSITPFLALAQEALDQGQSFEKALRRALKGVLCSPDFLYLEEPVGQAGVAGQSVIDDFALAARLSYFLWSSLPDEELHSLAARDELHHPPVLAGQVERMLRDQKSQRFVENFTGQWLKLREIDFTVPNEQLYPEYNQLLRRAMLDETHAFFREVLEQNLSVQTFIDSDFAMLNRPLAEFYGIEGVHGLEIRRVPLLQDSVRGGVLTQASVLKVSADGTRTSPVLRGAWVLENLFGTPSLPPPPTVEAIEPDIRGATTIREQLAKHRSHDSCNICHRRIDPPGFALESFDVIGGERNWYRTAGSGKPVYKPLHPLAPKHHVRYRQGPEVDASGILPDGRAFNGIREYKQLLLEDELAMPRAMTRLLLMYSLGRSLGFSDRPEIERILRNAQSDNYGLRSIIQSIVTSPIFRQP